MAFELNQIFEGEYPPEAATWCNENDAYIEELDPVTKDVTEKNNFGEEVTQTKTLRRFQILPIPAPTTEELAAQARSQRDALIAATDYLMATDYPLTDEKRQELTVYRQALRDVPEQSGFPTEIVWPTKPAWVK